ncbi:MULTISPECIES: HNH endonuclease [Rufibacter]|uniref:Putative restriction endonuclease n=1 Tax=Rufibacter quisquiliarum TaxID=1549639 RepID=A0A839GM76_9BACT|nr:MULTISPECIES: HNH endonuclease [Rufibacter]MBA9076037.1 putative restriction endonuclease [Rufibacter quisquiliarum]
MKQGQRLWTREELILAMNLYCQLPFGRLHRNNPEVVKLAELIGRTAGSVAFKLVNLASLDPSLRARGVKGAQNVSKLDQEIWNEFNDNWEVLPFESEMLRAQAEGARIEDRNLIPEQDLPHEGKVREQMVKVRVNQAFFRRAVLASYNSTCCITGLQTPTLLVAGHIRPWSVDEKNRLNPHNGLAINALHDKAFEAGLLTITPEYVVKVSPMLKEAGGAHDDFFHKYNGKSMILPSRFLPHKEFLDYHCRERFQC